MSRKIKATTLYNFFKPSSPKQIKTGKLYDVMLLIAIGCLHSYFYYHFFILDVNEKNLPSSSISDTNDSEINSLTSGNRLVREGFFKT